MDGEKRKRADDGATAAKKLKSKEHDGGAAALPPEDEEVEKFFEILKRVRVAVKYFQSRNGELTAKPLWRPAFERCDFDGAKEENLKVAGLDLNSDPVDVVAGSG